MTELEKAIKEIPELVKNLKEKFFQKEKFMEMKTSDGKTLSCEGDKCEVGMAMMLDGQPAPDGEYLTDMGKIVVKEGKVLEVTPAAPVEQAKPPVAPVAQAEAPVAPAAPEAPAPTPSKVVKYTETVFDSAFAAIEEKFVALEKENTELKTKQGEHEKLMKDIFSIVEKLAALPSETSKFKKTDGAQTIEKSGMTKLMEEAKELSNRAFKK